MALADLDRTQLPHHIAIIMDGNSRWAARRGLDREEGHEAGAKSVRSTVEACRELGIGVLSLYAFSTENWRRSQAEVEFLFRLLGKYTRLEAENLHKEDIRIVFTGRLDELSPKVTEDITYAMDLTKDDKTMILNVALNYGGRAEIADAAKAIAADALAGKVKPEDLDEKRFAQYLYRPDVPDPDMLIRTSGEMRLSNFMLWQLSYAEIVPLRVLWPD
ncbi:MAG: polyprenyl diphosphate synthase, partial [FCB group bacterium]|nr:polyprenyl diphosphate synthase [FCB group bacterium]